MSFGGGNPFSGPHGSVGGRITNDRVPLAIPPRPSLNLGLDGFKGYQKGGMMEVLSSLDKGRRAVDDTFIGSPKSPYGSIGMRAYNENSNIVDSMYAHHLECRHIKLQKRIDNVTMEMMKTRAEQTLKIVNKHNEWAEYGYINTLNNKIVARGSIRNYQQINEEGSGNNTSQCSSDSEEDILTQNRIARIGLDAPSILVKERQKDEQRSNSSPPISRMGQIVSFGNFKDNYKLNTNNRTSEVTEKDNIEGEVKEESNRDPGIFYFPKNAIYVYRGFEQIYNQSIEDDLLVFRGNFESSNIDEVIYLGQDRYFITIRKDVNSDLKQFYDQDLTDISQDKLNQMRKGKGNGWFMFEVFDLIPGREYTFYIAGFRKNNSLFKKGMLPTYMYFIKQLREIYSQAGEKLISDTDDLSPIINDLGEAQETNERISFCKGESVFKGHKATMSCSYVPQYYGYKPHPINQTMARLVNPDGDLSMLKVTFKVPSIDLLLYQGVENKEREIEEKTPNNTDSDSSEQLQIMSKGQNMTNGENIKKVRFMSDTSNSSNLRKKGIRNHKNHKNKSLGDEEGIDGEEKERTEEKKVNIRPSLSMILSLTFPYTYTMMKDMIDQLVFKMSSYGFNVDDKFRTGCVVEAPRQDPMSPEDSIDELIERIKKVREKDFEDVNEDNLDIKMRNENTRQSIEKRETDLLIRQLCEDFGLSVPLIQLGRGPCKIIIIGRIHPCESPGSYIIHGIIESFINWARNNENYKNTVTDNRSVNSDNITMDQFLSLATVYVVPMVNCSGVVCGNSRTNLMGTDLNRAWLNNSMTDSGTVYYIRKLFREISNEIASNGDKTNIGNKELRSRSSVPSNPIVSKIQEEKLIRKSGSSAENSEEITSKRLNRSNSADLSIMQSKANSSTSVSPDPKEAMPRNDKEALDPSTSPSGILLFLDLHGHMKKPNIFMYGCANPVDAEYFYNECLFPLILDSENMKHPSENRHHTFSLNDCRYNVAPSKLSTSRVFMRKALGIIHSYTLEASMGLFKEMNSENNIEIYPLMPCDYISLGGDIVQSIKRLVVGDYYEEAKIIKTEGDILREKLVGAGGVLLGKQHVKGPKHFVINDMEKIKQCAEIMKKRQMRTINVRESNNDTTSIKPSLNLVPGCNYGSKCPTKTHNIKKDREESSNSDSTHYSRNNTPAPVISEIYLKVKNLEQRRNNKLSTKRNSVPITLSPMDDSSISDYDKMYPHSDRMNKISFDSIDYEKRNSNKIVRNGKESISKRSSEEENCKISLTYDVPLFDRAINDPAFKKVNRCRIATAIVTKYEEKKAEELARKEAKSERRHKPESSKLSARSESAVSPGKGEEKVNVASKRILKSKRAKSLKSYREIGFKNTPVQSSQQRVNVPIAKQIITLPILDEDDREKPTIHSHTFHSRQGDHSQTKTKTKRLSSQDKRDLKTLKNDGLSKHPPLQICTVGNLDFVQNIVKTRVPQGFVSQQEYPQGK